MEKGIRVIEDRDYYKPNMVLVMFKHFTKYLHEHGFFNRERKVDTKPKKTPTKELWESLIAEGKHDLVKVLNHVENKDAGFGSIVVPADGFSKSKEIHNSVMVWLKERDINIVDVKREISDLKNSLKEPSL